jgi:hypothetical protein
MADLLNCNSRIEENLIDKLFNSSEKRLARILLLLANFGEGGTPQPIIGTFSQETLAEMIGIDPDYRRHVSERLLGQNDGPMLDALKGLNGVTIHLPARVKDRPDRDRLALRFERYKSVA